MLSHGGWVPVAQTHRHCQLGGPVPPRCAGGEPRRALLTAIPVTAQTLAQAGNGRCHWCFYRKHGGGLGTEVPWTLCQERQKRDPPSPRRAAPQLLRSRHRPSRLRFAPPDFAAFYRDKGTCFMRMNL